jgi:hypothetical protein
MVIFKVSIHRASDNDNVQCQNNMNHSITVVTTLQAGKSRVRFPMRSLDFFQLTESFHPHCGPGVNSASNRSEYQESFWD